MNLSHKITLLFSAAFVFSSCSLLSKRSSDKESSRKLNLSIVTNSGLSYVITELGAGEAVDSNDVVTVHYTGYLTDSSKFDSSKDRDQPFSFKVGGGQVIQGWDEGLSYLNVGDKATLTIPAKLGYGERAQAAIPANSTLIFDIEVLSRKAGAKPFDVSGLDTITTASGLKMIKLNSNDENPSPKEGDLVSVDYSGYLLDGKLFDSSIDRGEPIKFPVGTGRVIKGWDEAILLLHVGDKARLIIPSELAYGKSGAGNVIPPNATLIFDVTLIKIN
ncbi:FKBP-type peptidyl-prolyl cis-trans isomerase [Vicingaceae bacterium]|jgi:peptidylprolyl isomerase|nr:FKBP-type peptidyl-prolyl cis-trans isomerase [Vicingaceae bacterium]